MNPLVKKEIRLLLPSFLVSLLLALSIWLLPEHLGSKSGIINGFLVFPFFFCPVMLVITALNSFGSEFSSGTFSLLLAQPVPRARIWWTKTLLLAVAVLLVWFVWCYSCILSNQVNEIGLRDMEIIHRVVCSCHIFGRSLDSAFIAASGSGILVHRSDSCSAFDDRRKSSGKSPGQSRDQSVDCRFRCLWHRRFFVRALVIFPRAGCGMDWRHHHDAGGTRTGTVQNQFG